ncbi:MAG: 2-amino-4-hydroxy-6-hydroxymethyldihydropteridine diphosphokinase [Armatimonadetes bacterium]|nr:2-amino-4-hydroxy-6-hydroxymethyldihydropteridine diphosphokinase [Armatimonadota bacterium]
MEQVVAVALGSNVGNREHNIAAALQFLSGFVEVIAVSSLYETEPMYETRQPAFLNAAMVAKARQNPVELLRILKMVENMVGRKVRERNGPREIDLDLVSYGNLRSDLGVVAVPHPRAHERRFVLEPLNEIAPELVLPGHGSVASLLARPIVQSQKVRRTSDAPIPIPGH